MEALGLIEARVRRAEALGVSILCCPEAILGGLADYAEDPFAFAIGADQLHTVLAPLASETVTTIIGFTEWGEGGRLYNSAAVFHRGSLLGIYRKIHPFINRSVYSAGSEVPVFHVDGLTFGIVICYDSQFPELAREIAAQGASALFIPTNNGLPHGKAGPEIIDEARISDIACARENNLWVIRADVTGRTHAGTHSELVAYGSSGIVDPSGTLVKSAVQFRETLLLADVRRHLA
jgi:predicted amidohydrolase